MSNREPLDATGIVEALGGRVSPDLDAYTSGELPIGQVRCVACTQAPCTCQSCTAAKANRYAAVTGRPESEPCGMRVNPATGQCPRGHAPR